jgi:hypothetical protein
MLVPTLIHDSINHKHTGPHFTSHEESKQLKFVIQDNKLQARLSWQEQNGPEEIRDLKQNDQKIHIIR